MRLGVYGWSGLALAFVAAGAGAVAPAGPVFVLDVGSPRDADPAAAAFLDEGPGLSDRLADGDTTYRALAEGRYLNFRIRADGLTLAENGVPYRWAVLDIEYRDVVDETNCYRWSTVRAYCRPRLETRLDYGADPKLEWHGLAAFAGLADEAWKADRVFLPANPWQTLRAIDGTFEYRIYYPRQLAAGQPVPIDRITLRFLDEDTFAAQNEADRADRTLVRSDFVETNPVPPAENGLKYVVFARNYLEKIYPNTVPRADEVLRRSLRVFEVAGESEPVSLGIYARQDLQGVTATVTDFRNPAGATIAADRVRLNLVGVTDKRWLYAFDPYYGLNPWYLDDAGPFDVPAGTSRQLWLTIDVPAEAPAGRYEGHVALAGANMTGRWVEVILTVYDVALSPPDATPYVYHSPYMTYKHFAPRRSTAAKDMADHDINPIIYLDATIDADDLTVDFHNLDAELDDFQALGILPPEPRVGISDNVASLWGKLCPGADTYEAACPEFDVAYRHVLRQYAAFFAQYGVTPALSFTDEPGTDPVRRRRSNYLNRLTKDVGLRTWVTYYPRAEEPLAGHRLVFDDLAGGVAKSAPEWLTAGDGVAAYWDFATGTTDGSANGNDGALGGGATVEAGVLRLPSEGAYMVVPHSDTLSPTDAATLYLWLRPTACTTSYARHPVAKWRGTDAANYVLYFFGDYEGRYPDSRGRLGVFATLDGRWTQASGQAGIDCDQGLERWYNVVWVYDAAQGGTLYLNGVPFPGRPTGPLATNSEPLYVGRFRGAMDDVLLLNRALTGAEIDALRAALDAGYDQGQEARLVLSLPAGAAFPKTLTFALHDALQTAADLESRKSVVVNGRVAWQEASMSHPDEVATVDLAPFLDPAGPNEISLRIVNGRARREDLLVYFVEDTWREASWTVEGAGPSDNWRHTFEADPGGGLGPMAPYLDDRVHAMRYVTADQAEATRAAGDSFSFYTTYPANQPVIVNNRFLNGIFASAVGAEGVYVYAYGDWGSQPWDDMEASYRGRRGTAAGRRGQGNYALVMPSWEDRVYDTVVFEALREGIEDSRIIATLKAATRDHPGPMATEAQDWLADVMARPSADYAPRYMRTEPELPIEGYGDRSADILADLAGDETDYDVFDRVRQQMLEYIVALRSGDVAYLPRVGGQ